MGDGGEEGPSEEDMLRHRRAWEAGPGRELQSPEWGGIGPDPGPKGSQCVGVW